MTLRDASGSELTGSYDAEIINTIAETGEVAETTTVSSGDTVTLRGGQTIRILGLPNGATYAVTEDGAAGWTQTNQTNATGSIRANDTAEATFENTYSTSGSVTLTAEKRYLGADIEEGMFAFQVTDSDGTVIRQAYADPEDGHIVFDPIEYGQTDAGQTYVYYISEIPGDLEQVAYDEHVSVVEVAVTDNGKGALTATTTNLTDGDEDGIVFTNTKLFNLTVTKTVSGNVGDTSKEFDFTIKLWTTDGEDEVPYVLDAAVLAEQGLTATDENGAYSYQMRHEDSITLTLPYGVHYTVTEDGEDYVTTIVVTDGNGEEIRSARSTAMTSFMDRDQTVSVTNTLNAAIPTGADTGSILPVVMFMGLAGACLTLLAYARKKREA